MAPQPNLFAPRPEIASIGKGVANFGAGAAGNALGGAFVPKSKESAIAGTVGGTIGSAISGGNPVFTLIGSTLGTLVGALFGPQRLNQGERDFASVFNQINSSGQFTPTQSLAIARLRLPNVGSDSLADSLNTLVGRDIIPGTSFLRDEGDQGLSIADELNAFPESVNSLTAKGFKELVDAGVLTSDQLNSSLTEDLSTFQPIVGTFVPETNPGQTPIIAATDNQAPELKSVGGIATTPPSQDQQDQFNIDTLTSQVNDAQSGALESFRSGAGIDALRQSLGETGRAATSDIQGQFREQFNKNELQRVADLARRGLSSSSRATEGASITSGFANETDQSIASRISGLTDQRLQDQQAALTSGLESIRTGFGADLESAQNNIRGEAGQGAVKSSLSNFDESIAAANERFQTALANVRNSDNRSQAFRGFQRDSRAAAIQFNAEKAQDKKNAIKLAAFNFGANANEDDNMITAGINIANPNAPQEQTIANP